ncbi:MULTISPECIES: WXG100 family type VII secretion target [unclassified Gordonia (in: high G+C Gram-positive bacteria)]|uniref:WXG100 family type VII secretion target n=1 Tax=unclassified Gordonia (in: high G+C Gram-positive bacteria) TaxID=2657482 RepID=UPI001FFF97B9|nr:MULTISPECIES: WXG100 family type VII secretion target [unclassified Gordonia (in: high G+C Gram-positive bacteria)]UQE74355.1 WXG100 family type VII secretion target [Gordonia sp. PP30]
MNIRYNFENLGTLSGDLKNQFAQLEQLSGQLKKQVHSLAANWESGGAVDYLAAQQRWDSLFADARTRLDGLGTGVAKASTRMHETDQRVGKSFGV